MELSDLYTLYKLMSQDHFSLVYKGMISDDITEKMVRLSEIDIQDKQDLKKIKKKVPIVMVECFQNIIKHKKKSEVKNYTNLKEDFTATRNIENNYFISTANIIKNEDISYLNKKLNKVNKMTKEELKALYLEVLAEGEISEEGGAGLGLIEIAKKSGNKLTFDFEKVDDEFSLFFLSAHLTPQGKKEYNAIKDAKHIYNIMGSKDIDLIFKGDFSRQSIMPILQLAEENLQNNKTNVYDKKVILILVELLQNISKHALKKKGIRDGIFLFGKKDGHYTISGGNFISKQSFKKVEDQLNHINQLSPAELKDLYKKQLLQGDRSKKGGAGLGLIDMARNSANNHLSFTHHDIEEEESFFGLQVIV